MSTRVPLIAVAILAAGAAGAFWIYRKGSVAAAAASLAGGAVAAVGGAASGTVGAIGAAVGLPTPDETTTDARVARWIIDEYGYLEASQWSGAPALFAAIVMAAGSGMPPPRGSAIALHFANVQSASERARLELPAVDDYSQGIGYLPAIFGPSYQAAPYGGVQAESWGLPM